MGQLGWFQIVLQALPLHTSHQYLESHLQPLEQVKTYPRKLLWTGLKMQMMQELKYQSQILGERLSLEDLGNTSTAPTLSEQNVPWYFSVLSFKHLMPQKMFLPLPNHSLPMKSHLKHLLNTVIYKL